MADMHRWAFILEVDYDPSKITLSNYPVNAKVCSTKEVEYRCVEWIGPTYYSELKTWTRYNNRNSASQFLGDN